MHHSRQCVWTETRLGGRRGGTTVSSMVHHQIITPSPTRTTGVWCCSSTVRTSRALIPPLWLAVTTLSFLSWRITHSLSSLGVSLNCTVRSCGQTGLFDAYSTTSKPFWCTLVNLYLSILIVCGTTNPCTHSYYSTIYTSSCSIYPAYCILWFHHPFSLCTAAHDVFVVWNNKSVIIVYTYFPILYFHFQFASCSPHLAV